MLNVHGVTKQYGATLAVRNLSFSLEEREFLVIFGPAGAGKSTTLRLVAGITTPTYGEISFNGQSLEKVPPENRNFSMVFENYALYSHLTVFENLAFPLRARKIHEAEIKQQVQAMAEILGISTMLDRRPGFLSGGQRQRVALGRGLIREANIYLLDEPISHLDARLRIQMRAELKNLSLEKQSTVIHVTHDYREAMALADKVLVINKGRFMQEGNPEEIFHNPANEFVASFVGDPPMSFIDVQFAAENGESGCRLINLNTFIPIEQNLSKTEIQTIAHAEDLKLGLRANQIALLSQNDQPHCVPVEIYLVESQGHRNLVTVKVGADLIQIAVPSAEIWHVGENAWIALNPAHVHLFADGKAVFHPLYKDSDSPSL